MVSDAVSLVAEREEKLPQRNVPQLASRVQRRTDHVLDDGRKYPVRCVLPCLRYGLYVCALCVYNHFCTVADMRADQQRQMHATP